MGVGIVVLRFARWGEMAHDFAPKRAVVCQLVPAVEFDACFPEVLGGFVSCEPNNAPVKWPVAYQTAPATTATTCNQLVPVPCLPDH